MNKREPRPLVASDSMLRALTECAGTHIKGLRGSRKKSPTLSLVALERLENEIGARLHDDVLVLLALQDPVATLLTGIGDVNSIADAADEHAAPEGWVCIAIVYSDPVGEVVADAHGAAYLYLAVPREPPDDEPARVIVGWDGLDSAPVEDDEAGELLGDFIKEMLFDARGGEWGDEVSGAAGGCEPLQPQPALVRGRSLRRDGNTNTRVTHPKFGEGEVIKRTGEGDDEKVVVRFADKERTLLARFVQPAKP